MNLQFSFKNARYMQYVAAIAATLTVAISSTYTTWSSPSLPKLTSSDSPIGTTLTNEEASWVASSFLLGTIPGSLISGLIVEKLGRRGALLLSSIPLFVPWIAIILGKSALVLILARAFAGVGAAIAGTSVPMYIGEIAEKDIRGKLGATFNILKLSGSLFMLSVGPFISYKALNITCSTFPLIFAVFFYFMPESPYYLVKISDRNAARSNLIKLSKKVDEMTTDGRLEEISKTVDHDMKNKSTLWEFFSKREYRKSLIIMFGDPIVASHVLGIKTLQQFSGMNAIDSYMQTIIASSKSSISPEVSSIICGFIQIPAVLIAASLVDKMGRKPLMMISTLGCALALIGEGTYFYLQDVVKADVNYLAWLPTTALILYLIMNPIGLFTLPYILLTELFATNIKGVAVSFFSFYGGTLGFLVIKFFGPISDAWGMYSMFWIYAGICILGSVFTLFVLPETKGKSFLEIQQKLNKSKSIV